MSIKLELPKLTDLKPRITVIGVGGAGGNAVNNMISSGLDGVEFIVANTDAQALLTSSAEQRIQLGVNLTEGLGAGSKPEIGEAAAEEAIDEIRAQVVGSHMVFIACGMGGGTGTGAASVIARVAKEEGILTVGVVTKPFQFEGSRRMRIAEAGIEEMKNTVDTLIVIPNQNLFRIASDKTTFAEAFILADQVLYSGIACIVDLIVKEGLINLDFADVRVIMSGMGSAMMGMGEGEGERRATIAAEEAITNPLLDELTLNGAKGLLISIVGGADLTLYEVDEAASRVRQEVHPDANIIVGASFDETLEDRVRVSIVASGMDQANSAKQPVAEAPDISLSPPPLPGAAVTTVPPVVDQAAEAARTSQQSVTVPPKSAFDAAIPANVPVAVSPSAPQQNIPTQAQPSVTENTTWQAPGNVTIEEAAPQLAPESRPAVQQPTGPAQQVVPPASQFAPQFKPAPPQHPGNAIRRMPAVEDFPVVGQRDYRAKAGAPSAAAPATTRAVDEPPRKMGFFERLTGRRNQAGDASRTAAPAATLSNSYPQPVTGASQSASRGANHLGVNAATKESSDADRTGQDAELPMFFNQRKR